MVSLSEAEPHHLNAVFHALADPTRRAMLRALTQGDKKIADLAAPFAMSFVAASKHVRVLERSGLVTRTKVGRAQMCRLEPAPLAEADAWLEFYARFWTAKLDALDALFPPKTKETP